MDGLVDGILKLLLVCGIELARELLVVDGISEVISIRFETVLGSDAGTSGLILGFVPLGLVNHALDLLLRQASLVVGDGDAVRLSGGLVRGRYVQDAVGVDIEGDLDLRNTTRGRGDTGELELSKEVVVLGPSTLTLVDLDEYTGLVVGVGGEDLGFFGRNGRVSLDERSHDTTSGLDTKRQRSNIEQEQVLGLLRGVTREDGGLDGSTVCNGLIGVDALVGLLAVEKVGDELNDTWDTSGTADEDDLVNVSFVNLRVTEDLLNGIEGAPEEVLAQFLEAGTSEGGVEIDTLKERVDFDGSRGCGGKGSLGTLAGGTETTKGTRV